MEDNKVLCKNCEGEHEIDFEFCPYCGQKTSEDLTVGVLFYNTISNYFSFDARFLKSFIPLMFRPGLLAKRFIAGKRLLYLHPAQMYLFISVVFFFLFSFIVGDQVEQLDKSMEKAFGNSNGKSKSLANIQLLDSLEIEEITKPLKENKFIESLEEKDKVALDSIINSNSNSNSGEVVLSDVFGYDSKKVDSLIAVNAEVSEQLKAMGLKENDNWFKTRIYNQALKFQKTKKGGSILQSFYDSIPLALFILLPIFAMILKLFFWRRGAFAHHLVFSFYFYSFLFTVFSLILLTNLIWEIPDGIIWLIIFSTFFYLFLAIKHFYRQGYFVSFFKTSIVTFMYMTFVLPIAAVIMFAVAFMFY